VLVQPSLKQDAWILVAFWPNAGDGRKKSAGGVGLVLLIFSSLLAEEDQVALTGSTPLVVCCIVPATVRCKGVELSLENQESSRLSFLVKTDAWLYKMFGSIYYYSSCSLSRL